MKKFNKSKVIIPALAMIALTTAASATGTVAWFAANGTVTASSMTFKAVAGANLYIAKGANVALSSITGTLVDNLGVDVSVDGISPCDMKATGGTVTVQEPATWTKKPTVSDKGTPDTYADIGTVTSLVGTPAQGKDLTKYIALAFVTIARKQTNKATFDLEPKVEISFAAANPLNQAIRAGLIINDAYYESEDLVLSNEDKTGSYTWSKITGLSDNEAYSTALMIWYEGNDVDCISNNAIDVTKNQASWTFRDVTSA